MALLLLLLWRNLQFLLFTLPVCVKKTPGVGGTLLVQTNDRHTNQEGIIASQSLLLSPCYFFRPTQPPPPSFSTENAGYSAWVMRLNDFTTSGACLRAAKRRRKCAPLSATTATAVLLIILLWIARRRTHHDFWDRKEGRHWVRLELPNKRIKENYRLTVVVCLFNRMSRIGRAQNQNSTNLLDAPYFWHRLVHSESLAMYDFSSSSSTNFYSVFSFSGGRGLLFGMELVNYSKSRQQSRRVCVCLFIPGTCGTRHTNTFSLAL